MDNVHVKQHGRSRIALVQMLVEGGQLDRNLARAEIAIAAAAERGADLALLPETLDLGWTDPSSQSQAQPIPDGEPFRRLAAAARRHHIWLCAGLTEFEAGNIFNSAVLIDRGGELRIKHRKIYELQIGHRFYAQGDRLQVAHTELGTLGVLICADAKAKQQALSRALGYMGADLILSPSAWAKPADHDQRRQPYGDNWRAVYCPVAKEFSVWFLSASNVGPMTAGPWKGYNCIGCSMVIDPQGNQVLQGPYGHAAEAVLIVDVEAIPRPARGTLWDGHAVI